MQTVDRYLSSCVLWLLVGCGSSSGAGPDAAPDVAIDALDKAGTCASSFGVELTDSFGRLDGTILAVVPPGTESCAQPNGTHLVVQVTMHGAAYRMVVNLQMYLHELDAPLAGPAWAEGWHTDAQLDYVTTLDVHSSAFSTVADPAALVSDQLELGARISVFATSSGGAKADSAHLVHRNATNADGAIVIAPDTSPHYVLFRFSNQLF